MLHSCVYSLSEGRTIRDIISLGELTEILRDQKIADKSLPNWWSTREIDRMLRTLNGGG